MRRIHPFNHFFARTKFGLKMSWYMILFTQQMRIVSNIYATKSPTTNQNKFVQLKPNFHLGSNSTMILRISLWIFLLSLHAMETFTSFLYQTCINKDLACSKGVSCWAFWYKMRKKNKCYQAIVVILTMLKGFLNLSNTQFGSIGSLPTP